MTALATKRNPGRPRDLSFHERLDVALTWNERLNAQAKVGKSERHTALKLLMKKLIRLKTTGALPYKIFEVQAMMNSLGRYVSLEIRPPDIHYPTLDREVAVTFGIKPRMVRRCREELHEFLSYPWKEREHEALARVAFALKQQIRQLATQLMTPERLAKGEPLAIRFGGLWVNAHDSGYRGDTIQGPAPPGARCVYLATVRTRVIDSRERQAAYREVMAEHGVSVKEQ
jgi:hypothetical protein